MKLSELKTGESAVIVKVSGHGGFRKRVIEMGFIKGKKVDVLLNAPLQDPVKYKIMGYEVSLRHSEADHIEVVSIDEAKNDAKRQQVSQQKHQLKIPLYQLKALAKPQIVTHHLLLPVETRPQMT